MIGMIECSLTFYTFGMLTLIVCVLHDSTDYVYETEFFTIKLEASAFLGMALIIIITKILICDG